MTESFRYLGGATDALEHYSGVPARDLTAEEFAALGEREQLLVREGGLYERETASWVFAAADDASPPAAAASDESEQPHVTEAPQRAGAGKRGAD
jgi:hypothetical protein